MLALLACELSGALATPKSWPHPIIAAVWALGATGCAIAAAIWMGRHLSAPAPGHKIAFVSVVLWTSVCLLALIATWHLPLMSRHTSPLGANMWEVAANQLLGLVALPLAEETIVRGYLLARLREQMGATASVVVSAITFSLVRPSDGNAVVGLLMGMVLAAVVLRTGRFWLAPAVRIAVRCGVELFSLSAFAMLLATRSDVVTIGCGLLALLAMALLLRVLFTEMSWRSASERNRAVFRDALPAWMP